MDKAVFSGISVLRPGDSLLDDGGAFVESDRLVIDRLLHIGAKTHRHTGLDGLSSPIAAPSASVVASAGSLPPETELSIGYTLVDDEDGETLISPLAVVSTGDQLQAPTSEFAGVADYDAGSLPLGTYDYEITYIDAEGGETPPGPVVEVEREPGFLNAQVLLSGLTSGLATASAAGWRLYRATNGGDFAYLASGAANTYTDDGTVCSTGDITPPLDDFDNTTGGIGSLIVSLPDSVLIEEATFINLYVSEDGEFTGAVFIEQFPVSSAGASVLYRFLDPDDQQPPSRNLSIGGVHLIDPDTELLDWHWKRPVASAGALPLDADHGDVRVVLDEDVAYEFTIGDVWAPMAGAGGLGFRTPTGTIGSGAASAVYAPFDSDLGTSNYAVVATVEQDGGDGLLGLEVKRITERASDHATIVVANDDTTSLEGILHMVVAEIGPDESFLDSFDSLDPAWSAEIGTLGDWTAGGTLETTSVGVLTRSDVDFGDGTYSVKIHTGADPTADPVGFGIKFGGAPIGGDLDMVFDSTGHIHLYEALGTSFHDAGAVSLAANTDYWFVLEANGNDMHLQVWDTDPALAGSPILDDTTTLSGGFDTNLGAGVTGGLSIIGAPTDPTGWFWDDLTFTP